MGVTMVISVVSCSCVVSNCSTCDPPEVCGASEAEILTSLYVGNIEFVTDSRTVWLVEWFGVVFLRSWILFEHLSK